MTSSWSVIPVVLMLCTFISNVHNEETAAYGAYTNRLEKVSACRGPKQANLTHYRFEVRRKKDRNLLAMNITLTADAKLEMVKALTYKVTKTESSLVIKRQSNKPCDHQIVTPFLKAYFNITGTACVLKKGNYAREVDVEAIMRLVNPKWFYGLYQTRAMLYSSKGNIVCIVAEISVYPKTNATT